MFVFSISLPTKIHDAPPHRRSMSNPITIDAGHPIRCVGPIGADSSSSTVLHDIPHDGMRTRCGTCLFDKDFAGGMRSTSDVGFVVVVWFVV